MLDDDEQWLGLPSPVLAVGPIVVLGLTALVLYVTWPFGGLDDMSEASTLEVLAVLAVIGAIAGIVPVVIGMLWYPYIKALDVRFIHAFVALGAGVLAFIAVEMTDELVGHSAGVSATDLGGFATVDGVIVAAIVGVLGVFGTLGVMYAISRWRVSAAVGSQKTGLQIAYIVALALGLHSIGEGLAIGVNLINDEATLVMLLVIGFVIHNVLEGLTVVAALARDERVPRLYHFGLVGVVAGGPVILGGWIGSLGEAPLLAVIFLAIAIGAILQALLEMIALVRIDAENLFTPSITGMFLAGFVLMFVLESLLADGWLVGSY